MSELEGKHYRDKRETSRIKEENTSKGVEEKYRRIQK